MLFPASMALGQTWENMANPALQLKGAKIIAQDPNNTYLGSIVRQDLQDSVFNPVGPYGNQVSNTSIWNPVSPFGDPASEYSVSNPSTNKPPKIVKGGKVVGYLTVNTSIDMRLLPGFLKTLREQL